MTRQTRGERFPGDETAKLRRADHELLAPVQLAPEPIVVVEFAVGGDLNATVLRRDGLRSVGIDEDEARTTLEYLDRIGELAELQRPAAP